MKKIPYAAACAAILLFVAGVAAQTPAGQPPSAGATVQQQNEEILKELRAIRQLLERLTQPQPQQPPVPQRATITNLTGHALGRPDAPLTMVEFTDLQCPYCRQYMLTSFDEIRKNWIDTGKLRYVTRDFPLDIHAQAMNAARAARCSGEQGKFWEMHIALLRNANLLTPQYIAQTASDLKLDTAAFAACAASTKHDEAIRSDMAEGLKIGVNGTPMFVVGRSTPTGITGPVLVGALPYAIFDAKLNELMSAK